MSARREPFAMIPFGLLQRCRDAYAIHLYARLRSHANREGLASTDAGRLAEEIGASASTFKRALGNLRDLGFVQTKRRHYPDGSVSGLVFRVFDTCQKLNFDLQVKSDLQVKAEPSIRSDLNPLRGIDLKNIDLKDGKAGASAPAPCGKVRNDAPTEAQLWSLLTSITDSEGFAGVSELNQALRSHAARLPGFDYKADIDLVNRVVNKFVAAVERGNVSRGGRRR